MRQLYREIVANIRETIAYWAVLVFFRLASPEQILAVAAGFFEGKRIVDAAK